VALWTSVVGFCVNLGAQTRVPLAYVKNVFQKVSLQSMYRFLSFRDRGSGPA
jgi:hypothetical protein